MLATRRPPHHTYSLDCFDCHSALENRQTPPASRLETVTTADPMTSIDSYDDNRINSPLPTILNTSESEQTASTGDPLLSQQSECSSPPENSKRIPRQARKPSPGLAARLAALGFGSDSSKERQSAAHLAAIGKIPEDQIRYLESIHQLNSAPNIIQRSGRAWSGATAALTPQLTGDSYTSTSSADRKY